MFACWNRDRGLLAACALALAAGCSLPRPYDAESRLPPPGWRESPRVAPGPVSPASYNEPAANETPVGIDGHVALAVARNPRLAKATFAVDAARGRHIQAGLYPNPDLAINWDEIGDRTGAGGVLMIPKITQTFVTGRKLSLAQAVAASEIDLASLGVIVERYAVISSVRAAYYDLYTVERRAESLRELLRIVDESVKNGKSLLDNQKISRLDYLQLEVDRNRIRAEIESVERELPSARRALAAAIGDPRMPISAAVGPFDIVPEYNAERTLDLVLASNPEAQAARVGVERARVAVRRAQAEVIPNVTIYTGFIQQYENKSPDFALGANAPIPIWNRNQGAIRAAQAELNAARVEVARVENDLAERVAAAFRLHAAARRRAELYRDEIIPKATEAAELSLKAFQGGQFDYLRVIQAQRAVAESKLEYNKSLGDAWKGAAQLSGLLLEEHWPDPPRELKSKPKDER